MLANFLYLLVGLIAGGLIVLGVTCYYLSETSQGGAHR